MESRIMQVFYGNDCLPYKDSARSVHYPIVGNSFIGASGTTQIRFYVRDIGGVNNVSWVAISKLPNGQIGNQVLSTIALDSELGEYYVALDLGSYYTQLKGDVYISLNGYQGGIQVEQDAGTGIYTISGTPIIEATGSIKLAINYAPQLPLGHHFQIDDLQQVLGLISEKANVVNTVQVVANITTEDLSGYDSSQLFYDLTRGIYYKKTITSPYYAPVNNIGMLGSSVILCRIDATDFTYTQAWNLFNNHTFIAHLNDKDYLCQFDDLDDLLFRAVDLLTLKTYYANFSDGDVDVGEAVDYILGDDNYLDDILHEQNCKNYVVPYSGAIDDVDLGNNDLYVKTIVSSNNIQLMPTNKAYYGGISDGKEIATKEWTNSVVETLKANSFILVDTTTYPTLEDFLASDGEEGYIYLYPSTNEEEGYLEYIWESNGWLQIGTTQIDLTNYYTKSQVDTIANGKVDKTSNASKLYGTNASGNQTTISFTSSNNGSTIPLRNNDGNIGVALTPTDNTHATSKKYVDDQIDTRVAQTSEHNKVYGTDSSGNQKLFDVDNTVGADGNIVRRASITSQIMVPLTPTANGHASSKKYVDDSIANAISTVYKYKGTKTVAEINALNDNQVGDVYNVSDSGTLTAGSVQVRAGDNVAWTGSAWDKLAEDIDWTAYDEKFMAAGFFEVQNYNDSTGEITFVYATELYDMSYDGNTGVLSIEAI